MNNSKNCKLTFGELIRACKNIGFDLTCDRCATIFFMGLCGSLSHDLNCKTCSKEQPKRQENWNPIPSPFFHWSDWNE